MEPNCIFCKIINRTEKADILFEDKELIIFKDIKPAAKNHVLIIPKVHIKDAKSLKPENKELVEKLISAGKKLFDDLELNHSNTLSGFHWPPVYSVGHLHLHFINPASEMTLFSRIAFRPNSFWFVSADYVLNKLSNGEKSCRL